MSKLSARDKRAENWQRQAEEAKEYEYDKDNAEGILMNDKIA